MANPCKYTIKGIDTPLDYDQVRAYMLENYGKLVEAATVEEGKAKDILVDENGIPITVYHGTDVNFDNYDIEKATDTTRFGKGISFIDGKFIAIKYSLERQGLQENDDNYDKAIVKPANLILKAPFDERKAIDSTTPQAIKLKDILVNKYGLNPKYVDNVLSGKTPSSKSAFQLISEAIFNPETDKQTFMFTGNTEKTRKLLESVGYDSIIDRYEDSVEYFVFDSKNILPTEKVALKTKTDAIQEQGAGRQIPSAREAGQNIPEGGQGVRPSEQGKETAKQGEKEIEELAEPIVIFKGNTGKLNPDGSRRTAHPNIKGVFGSTDLKSAERYGNDISKFDIPKGTTVETVEIKNKKIPLSEARKQETELVNASEAQIVRLITYDAKGKEVQYVIKDKSILQQNKPLETETATSSFEDIAAQLGQEAQSVAKESKKISDRIRNFADKSQKKYYDEDGNEMQIFTQGMSQKDFLYKVADIFDGLSNIADQVVRLKKAIKQAVAELGLSPKQSKMVEEQTFEQLKDKKEFKSDKERTAYELGQDIYNENEKKVSRITQRLAQALGEKGDIDAAEKAIKRTYNQQKQESAAQAADSIISLVGVDDAPFLVGQLLLPFPVEVEILSKWVAAASGNPIEFDKRLEEYVLYGTQLGQGVSQFSHANANIPELTLQSKLAKFEEITGQPISDEDRAKFQDIYDALLVANAKISEAEARAKKAEEDLAIKNIQDYNAKQKQSKPKLTTERRKAADKAIAAIKNVRLKIKANSYSDATGVIAAIDGALSLIEKAIDTGTSVADAIEKGIQFINQKLNGEKWDEKRFRDDITNAFQDEGVAVEENTDDVTSSAGNDLKIPNALLRSLVENGVTDIETLTSEVMKELGIEDTETNHRKVRDAITGYGKTINKKLDDIQTEISKMTAIGRLLSGLEDVRAGMRSKRSGLQRRPLEQEERRLTKQLKELSKNLPMDDADIARYHKSALDAIKTRLNNRIADLEKENATGVKTPANTNAVAIDDEVRRLKAIRDDLQKRNDEIFGSQTATEAALKGVKKQIQNIEERIAANQLEISKKPSRVQNTPELVAAKARLTSARQFLAELQEIAGIPEKIRLEQMKKAADKRITTLKERIATGNFVRGNYIFEGGVIKGFKEFVNKKTTADSELNTLIAEKRALQREYDVLIEKERYKNRTALEKRLDDLREAWALPRALMATGEISMMLIQGGVQTIAHPTYGAKAFAFGVKNFMSEARAEKAERALEAMPDYQLMKDSKLALSEFDAKLTAREEAYLGGWINNIWDYLLYPLKFASPRLYAKWQKANLFKALERFGVGYMNTLRIQRFNDGVALLRGKGITFEDNPKAYKDVADVINTFTGRSSLGSNENASKVLSTIFFSPRNWASIIKQTTPVGMVWLASKTEVQGNRFNPKSYKVSTAQKMAIADYAKYVAATLGIVMLAAAKYNNDDDDETGVSFDPRSSDFMKIKLGDTRIDPWGGRIQMIIFQTRLLLGETVNSKGEVKRLGETSFVPTRYDLTLRMIENKLAPSTSMAVKALKSKEVIDKETGKVSRVDQFGNPYNLTTNTENFYPMYAGTVAEVLKEQPKDVAALLTFYAFLGGGVSTYEQKGKEQFPKDFPKETEKFLQDRNVDISASPKNSYTFQNRKMTDKEYENFLDIRARFIASEVEFRMDELSTLDPDSFVEEFSKIKSAANEEAKSYLTQYGDEAAATYKTVKQ
jgi:hypothetical protein